MTAAMATCMTISTATASGGWPRTSSHTSGRKSASVIKNVSQAYSRIGAELMRVMTGQPAAPIRTPMTVSLA